MCLSSALKQIKNLCTGKTMEDSDPLDKIPDNFKCPVCRNVPRNKIFQCREGHTICDDCYPRVTSCPQCRLRFGRKPIRNRFMEQIVDELMFECPFKSSGCKMEKVDRLSLPSHLELCSHNISKFGPFKNICKNLGYANCDFKMNRGNTQESVDHFESAHKALVVDADCFKFEIRNFPQRSGGTRSCFILNMKEDGVAFLIYVTLTDDKNKCLMWDTFYWRYTRENQFLFGGKLTSPIPFQVKCSLKGVESFEVSVSAIDIHKTGDQNPSMLLSSELTMPAYLFVNESSKNLTAMVKAKRVCTYNVRKY